MRVGKTDTTSRSSPRRTVRSADGFVLPTSGASALEAPAAPAATSSVASVDAVLALQGVDDAPARRDRSLRRGRRLVEALDRVRLAMVSGELDDAHVRYLGASLEGQREVVDDPELESLLQGIELRAKVELAKLQRSRTTGKP